MPVAAVADVILCGDNRKLMKKFVEITKWNNRSFTESEMQLLESVMENEWISGSCVNRSLASLDLIRRIPLILNNFSENVLSVCKSDSPVVRFNHLLRWRFLSLSVSEDLLTIPFLAEKDVKRNKKSSSFTWQNVIGHDNFKLNAMLDEELSDTHSHINAATDIFEFNWLNLMNWPSLSSKKDVKEFLESDTRLEYDTVHYNFPHQVDLSFWVKIAVAIRLMLFEPESRKSLVYHVSEALRNPYDTIQLQDIITNKIQYYRSVGLKANVGENGYVLDYAIPQRDFDFDISSPFMVHHGERSILYRWFHGYFYGNPDEIDFTPFVILYLLIKNKVRREFIMTNPLVGFSNFHDYQEHSNIFNPFYGYDREKEKILKEISLRYAVQSSFDQTLNHHVEARIKPSAVREYKKFSYTKSIFGNSDSFRGKSEVTFVAHFIKKADKNNSDDGTLRHAALRNEIWKEIRELIKEKNKEKTEPKGTPRLTGLDAASSELNCRPEVFAPVFRFARINGIPCFTFHAGEDYYDITDGLRTVYEVIRFMEYGFGDRIGHGLALGENVRSFYSSRHDCLIIPRQIFLDNLVWLYFYSHEKNITLSVKTIDFINRNFSQLIRELGYFDALNSLSGGNKSVSKEDYWESMKLRGDSTKSCDPDGLPYPDEVLYSSISGRNKNDLIYRLHEIYEKSAFCKKEGAKAKMINLPETFADDVLNVQKALLNEIEEKGIVIETNPTSNLRIGRFERYDLHPLTLFYNPDLSVGKNCITVSINTDDKGIFATSLRNEYSLMALSLRKKKDRDGNRIYSDTQIEDYLHRIAHYGNISRFKA